MKRCNYQIVLLRNKVRLNEVLFNYLLLYSSRKPICKVTHKGSVVFYRLERCLPYYSKRFQGLFERYRLKLLAEVSTNSLSLRSIRSSRELESLWVILL